MISSSRLSTFNSPMKTLLPMKFRWVSPLPYQKYLMTAVLRFLTGEIHCFTGRWGGPEKRSITLHIIKSERDSLCSVCFLFLYLMNSIYALNDSQ